MKKGASDLSSAILWQIENREDLRHAEATIERIRTYTIARFINLKIAKKLAFSLSKTNLHPDHITLLSLVAGLLASLCFASGIYIFFVAGAFLLQLHCTLDFADGYLARLKNKVSNFGALWDGVVNKIVELFCSLGISVTLFQKHNSAFFLIVGLLVILGHFMISYLNLMKSKYLEGGLKSGYQVVDRSWWFRIVKNTYGFLEHWDTRLYIISLFAIMNKLEIALIYFAIDFNVRWIFNTVKIVLQGFKNHRL